MDLTELVSISQAGVMLGKGYCSVRDLILKRRLEGWQQDGRWYVRRSSVETFLKRQTERDTVEAVR